MRTPRRASAAPAPVVTAEQGHTPPQQSQGNRDTTAAAIWKLLRGPDHCPPPRVWVRRGICHFAQDGSRRYANGQWQLATRENRDGTITPSRLRLWHVHTHIEGTAIIGAESPAFTNLIIWDIDAHPPEPEVRCRWCCKSHALAGPLYMALERARCSAWPAPGSPCPHCSKPVTPQMHAPLWPVECACPDSVTYVPTPTYVTALQHQAKAQALALVRFCQECGIAHVAVRSPRRGWHVYARWSDVLPAEELAGYARWILKSILGSNTANVEVWPAKRSLRLPCGSKQRVADANLEVRGRRKSGLEARAWLDAISKGAPYDSNAPVIHPAVPSRSPRPSSSRSLTLTPPTFDPDDPDRAMAALPAPPPGSSVDPGRLIPRHLLPAAGRILWFQGPPLYKRYQTVLNLWALLAHHFRLGLNEALVVMNRWCERHHLTSRSRHDTECEIRAHYKRWFNGMPPCGILEPEPNEDDRTLAAILVVGLVGDSAGRAAAQEERIREAVARIAAYCRRNGPKVPLAQSLLVALGPGYTTASGPRKRIGPLARDLLVDAGVLILLERHSSHKTSYTARGRARIYGYRAGRAAELASGSPPGEDPHILAEPLGAVASLHPSVAHAVHTIRERLARHAPGERIDLRASVLEELCGCRMVVIESKRARAAQLALTWLIERGELVLHGYRYFVPSDRTAGS